MVVYFKFPNITLTYYHEKMSVFHFVEKLQRDDYRTLFLGHPVKKLHERYVLVPTDKAQNDITIVCKKILF